MREIPQPPKQLRYRGKLPPTHLKLLAVVGSRKYTTYGQQVVNKLIDGLRDYPIGIVSGLALGMDSLAHEAALRNNLYTLAIPGGGLNDDVIYPAKHRSLARKILNAEGGLLSEFDNDFKATIWSFPQRNRLVAGISHATLLIEAGEKSGTLITARLATDYNRDLLVVPGSIFSMNTVGTHQFLKLGATPVTEASDILQVLGIDSKKTSKTKNNANLSPQESLVMDNLDEPKDKDSLIRLCDLNAVEASTLLMTMELKGLIKNEYGLYYKT